jgi:hypothetical protein
LTFKLNDTVITETVAVFFGTEPAVAEFFFRVLEFANGGIQSCRSAPHLTMAAAFDFVNHDKVVLIPINDAGHRRLTGYKSKRDWSRLLCCIRRKS